MAISARALLGRRLAGALLCAVLLVACETSDGGSRSAVTPRPTATTEDSLVIGLVGSLSGPASWRGEDAFEGAVMSVGDLNRRRSEGARTLELVSLDDEGDPARALELIEQLTESPRTIGIVYAGPPEALPTAEDALAAAGIPALLCYGDLYGARKLSAHVFQVSPSYLWESRTLARYLGRDRGYETLGVIAEDSQDGATAVETLRQEADRAGLRLKRAASYAPDAAGFERAVATLEEAQVEAVVIQGNPNVVAGILGALRVQGVRYTGTDDARIDSAPRRQRRNRRVSGYWRPQILGFDLAISNLTDQSIPVGMVASDTYARGAHYLPVPSFVRFTEAFEAWWDQAPTGWEVRAFDAVQMIGWAEKRGGDNEDLAAVLEHLEGKRFGGLPVTLGPDDHTSVEQSTVGLWTLPPVSPEFPDPNSFDWVPLARGFSIDGERTSVLPRDWRYLFNNPPPPFAPAPRFSKMRYGVVSGPRDPIR
ncbi:MAG: ABC transporter substrate-binding protein [Actinomycetota bacterium]